MKRKKLPFLLLLTLLLAALLCSCGAPTETESETVHETESETEQTVTWEQLLQDSLPLLAPTDTHWEKKLATESYVETPVLQGKTYDGKYLAIVEISLGDISDTVFSLRDQKQELGGKTITLKECSDQFIEASIQKFVDRYVNADDIYDRSRLTLTVYATAEQIEQMAKCPEVVRISSGDALLFSPPTTLEELIDRMIPPLNPEEDAGWQKKIDLSLFPEGQASNMPKVLDGKVYANGKYAIRLIMHAVPKEIVTAITQSEYPFIDQNSNIDSRCNKAYYERFFNQYIENPDDVISTSFHGSMYYDVTLYASEAEIEKYAKTYEVSHMFSADGFLEADKKEIGNGLE